MAVVHGMHLSSCPLTGCSGCYPLPPPAPRLVRTPRPKRNARGESADQSRTRRNREMIEAGRHPVTKVALLGGDLTCRGCVHAVKVGHGARDYWKCDTMLMTRGPGTDLRVSWPACLRFEPVMTNNKERAR